MTTLIENENMAGRWLPVLFLLPFQFVFGLIYSWGAISPAIHAQSGWSQPTLDLAFSLTPLALFPSVVWAGQGLRRISPKTLLAVSLVCFSVGGGGGLAYDTPWVFMLGYSVVALGIGAGLSTAACIAMVSRIYPERRGALGGALLALYGMSSVVSAPVFRLFDDHLGWRGALLLLLGLYAALGWLAWIGLPNLSVQDKRSGVRVSLKTMLVHRPLRWALALVLLAAPLGSVSFSTIGHLAHGLGFSSSLILAAVAGMAISNGLGRLGFGALADRYGARFSRNSVLTVNAMAAGVLIASLHGAMGAVFVVFPILIGLAFGGMAGKLPALAGHVVEEGHAETAFGFLFGAFALASFLGPLTSSIFGMREALEGFSITAILAWLLVRAAP